MASLNKMIIVGNLGSDPEMRFTPNGNPVTSFRVATNWRFTNSQGERKEETCFTDITFFGRSAEVANQYLRIGSKILIEGRLKFDQWVAQDGSKRSKHSIIVQTMQMLDSKNDNQQEQRPAHTDYKPPIEQEQKAYNNQPSLDIDEDEVPF